MFTGIVQEKAIVKHIERKQDFARFGIEIDSHRKAPCELGSSVAVNGVCLTVAKQDDLIWFDVMSETLQKTNLGALTDGQQVNVERSAKVGDEIGGHMLSGHVHTIATIDAIEQIDDENTAMSFQLKDTTFAKFIFDKGFIAINGASLTLTDVDKDAGIFRIYFIPHTLEVTTFGESKTGDKVNIEVDQMTRTIVETVERMIDPERLVRL